MPALIFKQTNASKIIIVILLLLESRKLKLILNIIYNYYKKTNLNYLFVFISSVISNHNPFALFVTEAW